MMESDIHSEEKYEKYFISPANSFLKKLLFFSLFSLLIMFIPEIFDIFQPYEILIYLMVVFILFLGVFGILMSLFMSLNIPLVLRIYHGIFNLQLIRKIRKNTVLVYLVSEEEQGIVGRKFIDENSSKVFIKSIKSSLLPSSFITTFYTYGISLDSPINIIYISLLSSIFIAVFILITFFRTSNLFLYNTKNKEMLSLGNVLLLYLPLGGLISFFVSIFNYLLIGEVFLIQFSIITFLLVYPIVVFTFYVFYSDIYLRFANLLLDEVLDLASESESVHIAKNNLKVYSISKTNEKIGKK